jgi:hypothetical protein
MRHLQNRIQDLMATTTIADLIREYEPSVPVSQ